MGQCQYGQCAVINQTYLNSIFAAAKQVWVNPNMRFLNCRMIDRIFKSFYGVLQEV